MPENNSRLLLLLKFGDIAFSPAIETEEGYKLIVSDPENPTKDFLGYFYTNISLFLSKKLSSRIPEEDKMEARIAFKCVNYNDTIFIDDKEVYKQLEEKIDESSITDLISILMIDDEFLIPVPAVL